MIVLQNETESEESEEILPRVIKIKTSLDGVEKLQMGMEVNVEVEVQNCREDEQLSFQWYYSPDLGKTWIIKEDTTEQKFTYVMDTNNWYYNWKVVVTVENKMDNTEVGAIENEVGMEANTEEAAEVDPEVNATTSIE